MGNFTVSGANKILLVGTIVGGGQCSSISWNGSTAGWVLAYRTNFWDSGTYATELWYLVGPGDATANIVTTHDNTDSAFCAVLVTNAHQTAPTVATNYAFVGTAKNGITNTITTSVGNLVVDVITAQLDGIITGQPSLAASNHTGNYMSMSATNAATTSTKMFWYQNGTDTSTWGWIALEIKGP